MIDRAIPRWTRQAGALEGPQGVVRVAVWGHPSVVGCGLPTYPPGVGSFRASERTGPAAEGAKRSVPLLSPDSGVIGTGPVDSMAEILYHFGQRFRK